MRPTRQLSPAISSRRLAPISPSRISASPVTSPTISRVTSKILTPRLGGAMLDLGQISQKKAELKLRTRYEKDIIKNNKSAGDTKNMKVFDITNLILDYSSAKYLTGARTVKMPITTRSRFFHDPRFYVVSHIPNKIGPSLKILQLIDSLHHGCNELCHHLIVEEAEALLIENQE